MNLIFEWSFIFLKHFILNIPVSEYGSVVFSCSTGVSYFWTGPNGWTSTEHYPTINKVTKSMEGMYFVQVINENGCVSEGRVYLRVNSRNKQITRGDDGTIRTRSESTHSVYPNPTGSYLYFDISEPKPVMYSIMDSKGQVMTTLSQTENNYISVENMQSGVYLIRWKAQDDDDWTVSRFVKIR
ncbi:MAG: T9SS type A sorting domain-containing protein [Saprospiraceae bacterium]|nr:T9SS type A sorting domain-containing protein [Saprospiraceae bacterium]MCO6471460.1 T9SS type A sorting domain-containing protein [Saprospiraceae bacterium]WKZ63279.1 MAG: T9SS type A sorting domain-containing protein [Saprospiraceae bacterium]